MDRVTRKKIEEYRWLTDGDPCEKCGVPFTTGDWPFCASPANPQGHARGTYGFRFTGNMTVKKWERMT